MTPEEPNIAQLVGAARRVAAALSVEPPPDAALEEFVRELLFGSRELWPVLREHLITEIELRDALLARTATFLCRHGGIREPSSERWCTRELQLAYEEALFGREATRTKWDHDVEASVKG